MKKVVVAILAVLLIALLVGCVNYKAYDLPQEEVPAEEGEEANLVDEIAQIERELGLDEETEEPQEEVVEEEVILPELSDEPVEEATTEEELQVLTVKENELIKLKVDVTDPDKDPVTYSFTKPLNKEGTWKTNYGDAGEYIVTLTATDGKLKTTKKLKIVVERVNVPPVIPDLKDILVKEGAVVKLSPQVTDPNKDAVTVTITEPLASGRWETDHESAGIYRIVVKASDGELESEKSLKLTVQNVNQLPKITGIEDVTVKEGEVVEVKPKVTDLDEQDVIVKISEPVGDDGVWPTEYTDHGEYTVTVTASDGEDTVTKKVKVVVEDVNKAPEIVDVELLS